jgi:hypothetical protein
VVEIRDEDLVKIIGLVIFGVGGREEMDSIVFPQRATGSMWLLYLMDVGSIPTTF